MSATAERELNAIREAATEWVVQLSSHDLTERRRAEFMTWLRRSPAHVAEYLDAEAAWQAMTGAATQDASAIRDVVREAGDVVDFPARVLPPREPMSRTRRMTWAAAAVFLLAIGVPIASLLLRSGADVYITHLGETRRVNLTDGSTVELNTQSKVRVEMSATAREVFIDGGEVFFKVAKDPARPFRVHSASTVVRALGTEFNVHRQTDRTVVTVVEGRVAVTAPSDESAPLAAELGAGQRVSVPMTRAAVVSMAPSSVEAARAVAWREQRLIFENESVAGAVAEFNRYNARQLRVDDPKLRAQRISGVFKADRPDALVDFLTKTGNVRAVEQASAIHLSLEP